MAAVNLVFEERDEGEKSQSGSIHISSATCPHCGAFNIFPGSELMVEFVCRECCQPVYLVPSIQ
jgi:hypothetical protein